MRAGLAVAVGCLVVGMGGARGVAQEQGARVMGTVATKDALVTGGLEVKGDRARLMSNTSVTAYDHTAEVKLERGGDVLVCATSQFHLLRVGAGRSLLFGLDRGALELHTPTEAQDVILTPDIRFTVEAKGGYDLRVRVARDGDTCVENAGKKAPVLMLNDAFSRSSYRVLPGQHVLFEHGDLREVVDNERSPCGCPSGVEPESVKGSAAEQAAAEHPFPAAQSEGLAPTEAVPNSAAGETQTQVSTSLSFEPGKGPPANAMETPEQIIADGLTPPAPARKVKRSFGYKFKRFWYRLFHPESSS